MEKKKKKIYDQFLNFVCLESDFFTLNMENSFLELNDPSKSESEIEAFIENVSTGLLCSIVTMVCRKACESEPASAFQLK